MSEHAPPTVSITLEPEGVTKSIARPKTVLQLLNRLGVRRGSALVIREGELLTQDRRVEAGDCITIRTVVSQG